MLEVFDVISTCEGRKALFSSFIMEEELVSSYKGQGREVYHITENKAMVSVYS